MNSRIGVRISQPKFNQVNPFPPHFEVAVSLDVGTLGTLQWMLERKNLYELWCEEYTTVMQLCSINSIAKGAQDKCRGPC